MNPKSLLIAFSFLFVFAASLKAQTSNLLGDEFFKTPRLTKSYRKDSEIDSVKQILTNELKSNLTQIITSQVEVVSSQNKTQVAITNVGNEQRSNSNNTRLIDEFTFKSNITSRINLQNPDINIINDKKAKTLIGSLKVKKQDFIDENYNVLQSKLNLLASKTKANSLQSSDASTAQRLFNEYNNAFQEIMDLILLISSISPKMKIPNGEMLLTLELIQGEIRKVKIQVETNDFLQELIDVKRYTTRGEYMAALIKVNGLAIKYPENREVEAEKYKVLNKIEDDYQDRIHSTDLETALSALDELIATDILFREKYTPRKTSITNELIEYLCTIIDGKIKVDEFETVKSDLEKLRRISSSNPERYKYFYGKYNDARISKYYRDIKALSNAKKYNEAYSLVREAKSIALSNLDISTLKSLGDNLAGDVANERAKAIKATRPYVWQFQVGYGALTNFNDIGSSTSSANTSFTNQFLTSYEVAIHRKTKINVVISKRGRDRSKSNLIGARLTIWSPHVFYKNANAVNTPNEIRYSSILIEPQLSMFAMKLFNLCIGQVFGDYSFINNSSVAEQNTGYYSLTFGLRPHFGNLLINCNAKLLTDFSKQYFLGFNASVNLALNFKRKFSSREHKGVLFQVRSELN
ncbi:MAG: hypothetical protein FJY17_01225 [Bacteroidetes bacterium]|nr:hypothetical protein [Bacteroidota bacterium]